MTFPCLRCGAPYEQARRRASHFCPTCRKHRSRERRTEWQRHARAARRELEQLRQQYAEQGMSEDYLARVDDAIEEVVWQIERETAPPLVADRMPPRSLAPAGPDEGTSTSWADVATWLDERARAVEQHPWFTAHPHWSFGVNGTDDRDEVHAAQ